jgi:hypothetical protein
MSHAAARPLPKLPRFGQLRFAADELAAGQGFENPHHGRRVDRRHGGVE